MRKWKQRLKRFWDEWGVTGDDLCGLIGAIGVTVVLPCVMMIIGSMWV